MEPSPPKTCESPDQTLITLAIYDIIDIVIFLLLNNQLLKRHLSCNRPGSKTNMQKPWSFKSAGVSLVLELGGAILSAYFTGSRNANSSPGQTIWHNLQIWSVRPRVTWFKGNMAQVRREWGYMNDSLSSVVMELLISCLSIYCVGNFLVHGLFYQGDGTAASGGGSGSPIDPDQNNWKTSTDTTEWGKTMMAASIIIMISLALQVIWALYLLVFRVCYTRGRGEADDMDSLKWIARTFVPITCLCSWLIWAAYLYMSPTGAYCPYRRDYINIVWAVVPFLTSGTQALAGRF